MSSPARLVRLAGGIAVVAASTLGAATLAALSSHGPVVAVAAPQEWTSPTPSPTPTPTLTPEPTPTPRPTWSPPPTPTPPTPAASSFAATQSAAAVQSAPSPSTRARRTAAPTATAQGQVLGVAAPTPVPTAGTSVTAISGGAAPGGPSATATRVPSPPVSLLTAVGMGGSAALLSIAIAWRALRPRRRARLAGSAAPAGAVAVAELPESALFRSWRTELDDLADLAALTVPPEELAAARERRRAFRADDLARRLTRSVEQFRQGT